MTVEIIITCDRCGAKSLHGDTAPYWPEAVAAGWGSGDQGEELCPSCIAFLAIRATEEGRGDE